MTISLREPKTQKILLFTVLGLGILYLYFLTDVVGFTYEARASEVDELSARYQKLSSDLTKARQTLQSRAYLEKEFDLLHQKWERAQSLLPSEQEMASLLRAITLLGDRSGVEFILFRPGAAVPAQYHTEHPIEVKVEGGYHEIGTFLSELANMERIVIVSNLTLETPRKEESHKPARASFTATTYTLGGTGVASTGDQVSSKAVPATRGSIARQAHRAKETVTKKLEESGRGGTEE